MAFDKSKKLLQSANLLVHFQPDLELILASDASDYGVGAVLSHWMADEAERPIGYVSRSLNKAERGYSTIEKEALAIIFGVKKFNQFLYGQKFTTQTDHKPLEELFNEKKEVPQQVSPRVQQWALTLAAYKYKIAYKAGTTNANADAVSRLPLSKMTESVPVPGDNFTLRTSGPHPNQLTTYPRMDKVQSCSLKSAPVYTEWMATPLPGCAATPIFEPESRINHRRWMRSMGKQGDSTTSRTSTSHSRASQSPSRHIKNESPCTWLCVVAKHGSRIRRCSEEVSAVPTSPEGPSRSTSPPMGVAWSTLVKSAY